MHICENHSEVVALPLGRFALCCDSQSRSWLRLSTDPCLVLLKLSEIHRENRSNAKPDGLTWGVLLILIKHYRFLLDFSLAKTCWIGPALGAAGRSALPPPPGTVGPETLLQMSSGKGVKMVHCILFYPFSLHFFGTEAIKSMPAVYFQQLGLGNRYSNRDRAISWVFVCFNGTVRLQEAQLGGPPVGLISAIFVTTMSCSALHTCHLRKCILSRSCSEVTISGQLI